MLLQKQLAAAEQQAAAQSSIPVQPTSSSQGGQLAPPSPAAAPTPSDVSHSSTPSLALASLPNPALSPNASAQSGASTLTPSQRKSLIRHQLMQRRLQKMGGSLSVDLVLPGEREAGQAGAQSSRSESDHARLTDSHSLGALPPGIGSGIVQDGGDVRDEMCSPSRMDMGDGSAGGALVCALCCTPVSHRPPPPAPPLCANCSINAVNQFGLQLGNPAMFPFLPLLSLPQMAGAPRASFGLGDGASGLPPSTLSLSTAGACRPSRFLDITAAFNPAMFIPSPIAEERIQTTDFQTGTLFIEQVRSLFVRVRAMSFPSASLFLI